MQADHIDVAAVADEVDVPRAGAGTYALADSDVLPLVVLKADVEVPHRQRGVEDAQAHLTEALAALDGDPVGIDAAADGLEADGTPIAPTGLCFCRSCRDHANKRAGDLTFKTFESIAGAENALGIDIDGQPGAGGVGGPVTIVYGNTNGGAADFAIILLNTRSVTADDFIFDTPSAAVSARQSAMFGSSVGDYYLA